jgi:hypothetical protein
MKLYDMLFAWLLYEIAGAWEQNNWYKLTSLFSKISNIYKAYLQQRSDLNHYLLSSAMDW